MAWGVKAYYYERGGTTDQAILETKETLKKEGLVRKGDLVVNLASMPASSMGMTNMIKLSKVE